MSGADWLTVAALAGVVVVVIAIDTWRRRIEQAERAERAERHRGLLQEVRRQP